ncbi:hypothetical protein GE061_004300, partial [Apolygus lucorum]
MPRCLMAKKWKGYPWPDDSRRDVVDEEEEEIDVVGDTPTGPQIWGPSSPTAAATAPSPPPPHHSERIPPVIYNVVAEAAQSALQGRSPPPSSPISPPERLRPSKID